MSDRVSETILLCEDDLQEQLVRRYLRRCGFETSPPQLRVRNASRAVHGGNVGWVLREFPLELEACRKRHASRARTKLIVVVDADDLTVAQRLEDFRARGARSDDPLVSLVPRRHVETWIRAARGEPANEVDSYKSPRPSRSEVEEAAHAVYGWARGSPAPGPTCVDSLRQALPEFRKLC